MLIVETIGRIRRAHLWSGKSIRQIARDLKISRNTVRRIVRSGEPSFSYEREIQPRPKLGRWKGEIDRMLTKNAEASARELSNRVQSRPPFASNIDPPCAGWNPPGARECDNQDEKAPPLSLRSEGVARPRERQRRRGKILAVAMAWRGTCRVRRKV